MSLQEDGRFEAVGYIEDLENNDPEDTIRHRLAVSRCSGCRGLVLEGDKAEHLCLADLIADEIRALREATDSYVGYAAPARRGTSRAMLKQNAAARDA